MFCSYVIGTKFSREKNGRSLPWASRIWLKYENKLEDRMIKQLLNSVIAKYRDFICQWQADQLSKKVENNSMWFLNWRAEEKLVVNKKDNRMFMSQNYRSDSCHLEIWCSVSIYTVVWCSVSIYTECVYTNIFYSCPYFSIFSTLYKLFHARVAHFAKTEK